VVLGWGEWGQWARRKSGWGGSEGGRRVRRRRHEQERGIPGRSLECSVGKSRRGRSGGKCKGRNRRRRGLGKIRRCSFKFTSEDIGEVVQ
jgi:hypothetical protein